MDDGRFQHLHSVFTLPWTCEFSPGDGYSWFKGPDDSHEYNNQPSTFEAMVRATTSFIWKMSYGNGHNWIGRFCSICCHTRRWYLTLVSGLASGNAMMIQRCKKILILFLSGECEVVIRLTGSSLRDFVRTATNSMWRMSRDVCACNFLSIFLWRRSQLVLSSLLEVFPHVRVIFKSRDRLFLFLVGAASSGISTSCLWR